MIYILRTKTCLVPHAATGLRVRQTSAEFKASFPKVRDVGQKRKMAKDTLITSRVLSFLCLVTLKPKSTSI